jgi:hypothetical protein
MILDSPIEIFMNLKFRLLVAATVLLSTLCVAQAPPEKIYRSIVRGLAASCRYIGNILTR